jgi:hypothetical protein
MAQLIRKDRLHRSKTGRFPAMGPKTIPCSPVFPPVTSYKLL